MAYGGKRGGAGERVLEGRHVIGLFCLMLLFSGVFFTLGYVMGKNQFDTQVRAADPSLAANPAILPKKDPGGKRGAEPGNLKAGPDATPMYPEWEFYHAGNVKKADDHLKGTESAPPWKEIGRGANGPVPARVPPTNGKPSLNAPATPAGAYLLQVVALKKKSVALGLAANLQKKKFPAFVTMPNGDKFYRVQVGPYADQKSTEAAKRGLESAGFRDIVVRH